MRRSFPVVATSVIALGLTALAGCAARDGAVNGPVPPSVSTTTSPGITVSAGDWSASLGRDRVLSVSGPDGTHAFGVVLAGRTLQEITDDGRVVTVLDANGRTVHLLDTATRTWRTANGVGGPAAPVR